MDSKSTAQQNYQSLVDSRHLIRVRGNTSLAFSVIFDVHCTVARDVIYLVGRGYNLLISPTFTLGSSLTSLYSYEFIF